MKGRIQKLLTNADILVNGTAPHDIIINDDNFYKHVYLKNTLGLGESYMDGMWDCCQLDEFISRLIKKAKNTASFAKPIQNFLYLMSILLNKQSKRRSLDVAVKHYNLDNELFQYMLGDTMAYTCGYWKTATTLEQAQIDKFELIAKKIGIKANQHILELGCGWGTFAKYIAEKYGCRVTAVNISEAQIEYAKQHVNNLPINYVLCDYRDQAIYNPNKIKFDAVVSVGLCEHVGYKNYKHLAQIALNNMAENGLFLLHTIGNNISTRHVDPWFNKYIFPHGVIPSIAQLSKAFENTFVIEDLHNFGAYYDNTLMAWHKNFNDSWEHIKHDYDERFRRMWNYYLLASAAGFRTRTIQLWQFVLSPHGIRGVYHRVS